MREISGGKLAELSIGEIEKRFVDGGPSPLVHPLQRLRLFYEYNHDYDDDEWVNQW